MSTAGVTKNLPPMLQQYLDCKRLHPDALIFFQVGDFYEAFFEDAVILSRTLNITLTSRDKGADNPIPMAGVPLAVVDNYASRLVDAGLSVAIYSQVTSVGKGFDRQLERIITPGIRLLSNLGDSQNSGTVLAVLPEIKNNSRDASTFTIAYSSLQDGRIITKAQIPVAGIVQAISQVTANEIIIPAEFDRRSSWVREIESFQTQASLKFRTLKVNEFRDYNQIEGFTLLDFTAKQACQLLLAFIDEVTVASQLKFLSVAEEQLDDFLLIDANTRRNLELLQGQWTGNAEGSLYALLNKTATAGGERLLSNWISRPLRDKPQIIARQDAIQFLLNSCDLRNQIVKNLALQSDLERFSARLQLKVVLPSELAAVRNTLLAIAALRKNISSYLQEQQEQSLLHSIQSNLDLGQALLELLNACLEDHPPSSLKEAGIFRSGYNADLDRLIDLCQGGSKLIVALEQAAQKESGLTGLKIKYNNVLGYYFEVSKSQAAKLPENYIRRQSTVNSERFFTEELKELEQQVTKAAGQRLELEKKLFEDLKVAALQFSEELRELGQQIAQLDVLCSLAQVADLYSYIRPEILEDQSLFIEAGKHPVIAANLGKDFVSNNLDLNQTCDFIILTGPNMGGKSTFLRQAALLVIMAQMGSFLPAAKAQVGLCDRIFARIGASDNLLEGQSTFMLEMREAAQIMASASEHSLILIDELGRGTATSDGLTLAQATIEWIHNEVGSRTIFATHFYELIELDQVLTRVKNFSVASIERDQKIVFTHQIVAGPANCSYGLEVARMAGVPQPLLERAQVLLAEYAQKVPQNSPAQLSFFDHPLARITETASQRLNAQLADLLRILINTNINELTPIQSMQELDRLISEARELISKSA